MANLNVSIHKLELKNPVMTASGTFGNGTEFDDFIDVNQLGGIILKGTTLNRREGNDYPRLAETSQGLLNAVGLQNKGVDYFCKHIYPSILKYDTNVIVNINGSSIDEYVEVARSINDLEKIAAIELNISCPNVKQGGMAFGTSKSMAETVTKAVRNVCSKTLIVKLSPNVTNIAEMAQAVEGMGADSVSLVNTFLGMAIDVKRRKPVLSTVTGGFSGPAIKPIALRMVWQVAKAVKIPVIGIGGIMTANDALEFLIAGATAIEIGTANLIDPTASIKIKNGINEYLDANNFKSVKDLIGCLQY